MVEYVCQKCYKKFDKKDSFNKHMNKKYPCSIPPSQLEHIENKLEIQEKEILELKEKIEKILEKKTHNEKNGLNI